MISVTQTVTKRFQTTKSSPSLSLTERFLKRKFYSAIKL